MEPSFFCLVVFPLRARAQAGHYSAHTVCARRNGTQTRVEGIPALGKRLEWGKTGILYSFGVPEEAESPLIWDVFGKTSLAERLNAIPSPEAMSAEIQRLREVFRQALFTIDGHRI